MTKTQRPAPERGRTATGDSVTSEALAKRNAALLSVFIAALLIALKATTGWVTNSVSVWASLLDSTIDIFASIINFIAVRAASRPPDEEHLYGHGKAESLAGLFQSLVIMCSGVYLIYEAVRRLVEPTATGSAWFGVGAMILATIITLLLVARLRRIARQTDSPALSSDALHYATDVYTNLGALAALLLTALTALNQIDSVVSIFISLYILWTAARLCRESIDVLMDRRLPAEIDEQVATIVHRFIPEGVVGFHDLRTRRSGAFKFIDLHLEVERGQSLERAHNLTVKVLREIESEIPRSRVQIHTDPAN